MDGSNIATEGRSTPSLAQLNDAVLALIRQYPAAKVSVVVDATFGHRIAKKEVAEFNKAIEHNELVAPPAGAVGRGDAFILAIAEQVKASILSNDSYQEFHGTHKWLFEPGRLIGGKPVPHVGWVFVERLPVRGPTSKRASREGRVVPKVAMPSPEARKPMPIPKSPPPQAKPKMANEVLPYLQFVERNPIGSKVRATVAAYTSNGADVRIGDVHGYVPLRNMASPPPRAAREVFTLGDTVTLQIVGYTPARRSVDLGVPGVVTITDTAKKTPVAKAATKKSTAKKTQPTKTQPTKTPPTKPQPKKTVAKKAAAKKAPAIKTSMQKTATIKPTAKKTPAKVVAKKAVAKKLPVKKVAKKQVAPAKKGRGR